MATSSKCLDVVVVGSCMIDLVSYVEHLPKPGETIHGHTFAQGFGGKGANQCVMAARLGARCAMVAKLGDDSFGHSTVQNFKDNGINTDFVTQTDAAASGVASITVNDKGENAIVIVSGANQCLLPEEVVGAREVVEKAKVVVCQLEISPETTLAALKLAKKSGAITILNTAPGLKGLGREYFENTDILCLNETEVEILTEQPVTDLASAHVALGVLQRTGTNCVVLTLGEKGLLYSQKVGEGLNEWSAPEHIEAECVEVVDTTGAGDAFVGALASYLATSPQVLGSEGTAAAGAGETHPPAPTLAHFLRQSAVVATHTVQAKGTQSSYDVRNLNKELLINHPQ